MGDVIIAIPIVEGDTANGGYQVIMACALKISEPSQPTRWDMTRETWET
jgi:hypothetical protein